MKIVITESLGVSKERIEAVCQAHLGDEAELVIYEDRAEGDAFVSRVSGADIIMEVNQPIDRAVLERCPDLKMIAVAFAGIDHIDMDACEELGIKVANCPGYSASAVAELVFGFLTMLKRNLVSFDRTVRKSGTRNGFIGTEIGGKNFGIIGFGHIGKIVARIAVAYGCRVFAYTRNPQPYEGVTFLPLEELLATCDIVSLHLPLTAESRGLLNKERIGKMKKGAILINTARGLVVDYDALAEALSSGYLSGAGIDVFEGEPPVDEDHPLFSLKNAVVAAPHIGFATEEAFETRLEMCFEAMEAFQKTM